MASKKVMRWSRLCVADVFCGGCQRRGRYRIRAARGKCFAKKLQLRALKWASRHRQPSQATIVTGCNHANFLEVTTDILSGFCYSVALLQQ